MRIEELWGAWKLIKFSITAENSERRWRPNAHGLLIYDSSGHMSVSINSDVDGGAVLDSFLFYAGSYSVHEAIVTHEVTNATDPSRIGKTMIREASICGNDLTLLAKGEFGTATLVWRKIL